MNNNDLVSVIMSTYNEELKWIEESINSILNQSYSNIELIIILDNPQNVKLKHLLRDYAKSDNRICLIVNNENIGLVKSLNIALKHCKGKYIARMDADDISSIGRLNSQKEYLENNNLDFVYSGVTFMNEEGLNLFETNKYKIEPNRVKKLLKITNISYHPTWFLKKEIYETLNGYREIFYCEDYDFSLRCISKGFRIGKMDQNVLRYRVRKNSISRSYSLEQYLNSRGILKLYKQRKLEDIMLINKMMDKSKNEASKKENEKYINADRKFNGAITLLKNQLILKGIIEVIKVLFTNRYIGYKLIDLLKYKIKSYI